MQLGDYISIFYYILQLRTRIIVPAILKAMNDPFYHCRCAAIRIVLANISYLDKGSLCSKILPQICHLFLDKSSSVREVCDCVHGTTVKNVACFGSYGSKCVRI